MKDWLVARLNKHRSDIKRIKLQYADNWSANDLPAVNALAPLPGEPPLGSSGSRLPPALDKAYEEFLNYCAGFPLWPVSSDDTFRIINTEGVVKLKSRFPEVISRWNSGPATARSTPPLDSFGPGSENIFDARELRDAFILAAGDYQADPLLMWIPNPRNEYWYLSTWSGCWRFAKIEDAFDHILKEVVRSLDAQLQ